MRFEWDPAKAASNLRMHKVRFAEAMTVLEDDFAITREDIESAEEERYVTLGISVAGSLLVVVYTYRGPDVIRIVSAWKANRREINAYEEGRR